MLVGDNPQTPYFFRNEKLYIAKKVKPYYSISSYRTDRQYASQPYQNMDKGAIISPLCLHFRPPIK